MKLLRIKKSSERISWDDLIFKDRNKAYGAYEIRKKYPVNLAIGLIFTLAFAFAGIFYLYINSINNQVDEYQELFENLSAPENMIDLSSIIEEYKIKPQIEIKKENPENIKITEKLIIDSIISDNRDDLTEAEKNKLDSLQKDSALLANKKEKEEQVSDSLYLVYDLPKFPGGPGAFNAYVLARISSSKKIKKNNFHGLVQICFSIDKFGNPMDIFIKDSMNPELDSIISEIFKTIPKWVPSTKYNKNLKVVFNLPVIL